MYKNQKLNAAVAKVKAFEQAYNQYKIDDATAREMYSKTRYQEESARLCDALKANYNETARAVADCLAEVSAIKGKRALANQFQTPTEDFKFLQLPVTLSMDQLVALYDRNRGNALFCQALGQYAQKNYPNNQMLFASEPDQVSSACDTISTIMKPFSMGAGVTVLGIGTVVEEMSWAFAGLEDRLIAADQAISAEA